MDTNLGRTLCRLLLTLVLLLLAANAALAATVTFVRDRDFEASFTADIKIDGALMTRLDPGQRYVVDLPQQSYAVEISVTSLFGTKYENFTLEVAGPSSQVVFLSVVEERRNGQNVKHKLFTEAAFKESKYASLLGGRVAAEVPQRKKPAFGNSGPAVVRAMPTATSARVSFVREDDFSVFATIDVLIDGEKVATLKTRETAAVQLPSGGHIVDLVTTAKPEAIPARENLQLDGTSDQVFLVRLEPDGNRQVPSPKFRLFSRAEFQASRYAALLDGQAVAVALGQPANTSPALPDSAEIALAKQKLEQELEQLRAERSRIERETAALAEARTRTAEELAANRRAAEKLAAEKEANEKLAAEKRRAEQAAAEQAATARLAAETRAIEQQAAAAVRAAQLAAEEREDNIAVIIGNRNYASHHADVPDVSYAAADAEAIHRYVRDVLGYREGNIIFLKDATQAEMISVFGNDRNHRGKLFNWIRAGKSDLFVYYSGHGAPGLSDGAGYLLPVDADPMAVELNGYPLETLYRNLAKIPARQVTVVLDACFSGSSASGSIVRSASSIALRQVEAKGVLGNGSVLTAAGVSEVASWDQERKLGLFTAYFLDGINGAADRSGYGDGDGIVRLGELKGFLQDKVSYWARRNYYREQHPQVSGDESRVMGRVR